MATGLAQGTSHPKQISLVSSGPDSIGGTEIQSNPPSNPTKPISDFLYPILDASLPKSRKIPNSSKSVNTEGDHFRKQFLSISRETDPELYCEALYHFAQKLEAHDYFEAAINIYGILRNGALMGITVPKQIQKQAASRYKVFTGGGSSGEKFELYGKRLVKQTLDPSQFIAMTGTFVLSNLLLGGILSRGAKGGPQSIIGTLLSGFPIPARYQVKFFIVPLEAFTYPSLHNGVDTLLGRPKSFEEDEFMTTGVFQWGILRLFHFMGKCSMGTTGEYLPKRIILPQFAALTGVLGMTEFFKFTGMIPARPFEIAAMDTIAGLIHFNTSRLTVKFALTKRHQRWIERSENRILDYQILRYKKIKLEL